MTGLSGQGFIEEYRRASVNQLFGVNSFADCWPAWKPRILELTLGMKDPRRVLGLGDHLAEIFRITASGGRAQSSLSGGGAAWECLVCWYLNTVMTGSRAVAMKPVAGLVPRPVTDATCIVYGNAQTNTESDLAVVVFPPTASLAAYSHDAVSDYVTSHSHDVTLGVVQCKTNWNDNAQIPMLWDMVYRAIGFAGHAVTVGRNGMSPRNFREFSYSFVTVPSQGRLDAFKSSSMAVKRVRGLSGGNYWGNPTRSDVALSVGEIFNRNFGAAFDENLVSHVSRNIGSHQLDRAAPVRSGRQDSLDL